jgi:predicted nucleotidyltransferase
MDQTAIDLTSTAMETYRRTARARARARQERVTARQAAAWAVARRAAAALKEEFGASRVAVFGSLVRPKGFHLRSDVDLAVWGLDERLYFRAVAHLLDLDPSIEVDLVEVEQARPALQAVIQREGVLL